MNSYCDRHRLHSLFLLLFAILVAGTGRYPGAHAVKCLPDERALLLDLKHGFRLDHEFSKPLVSWKPGSNCCSWESVTCDTESGHVIGLDLSDRRISGNLSSSLFNLTSLQNLNLAWNYFKGVPIPQSGFEKLTKLTHLNLSWNRLSGQIPIDISRLTSLISLDLSSNDLQIRNPNLKMLVKNLSNLRELHLYGVIMSSEHDWSKTLSTSLPRLQVLSLSECDLPGSLPKDFFSTYKNLTVLDLSMNRRLSGALPDFPTDNALQRFYLVGTNLSGPIPASIANLNQLLHMDLSFNCLTGVIPTSIGSLIQLESMHLSSNHLSGPVPTSIANLTQLVYMDLSSNHLSGPVPSFGPEAKISNLVLYNNSLIGPIPTSLCYLPHLIALDLSYNNISGSMPSCLLEGDNSLVELNLRENQLQGIIPQNISRGCTLEVIILDGNNLQGQLPRSMVNCKSLQVLDLGNNHIVDSFPFWLRNLVTLRVLILRANKFYGPINFVQSHGVNYTLPKLQVFDLSSNNFNGDLSSECFYALKAMLNSSQLDFSTVKFTLPEGNGYGYIDDVTSITNKGEKSTMIKLWIIFTCIDFSDNAFEGDIPEAIGELQGLRLLNLSHNFLSGEIPPTIGSLKLVESLDLSANHLSGKIPKEITSLTFLSYLNLSNNNFVGKIPQGNQFSTFSNASFQENPRLCGSPLLKQCDNAPSNSDSSVSTYVIVLALFVGLGFGVGFATILVFQNMPLKFWRKV